MHTKTEVKKNQMLIFMQIHQLLLFRTPYCNPTISPVQQYRNCNSKVDACKYIFQKKDSLSMQLNLKLTRLNVLIVHIIITVTQNL